MQAICGNCGKKYLEKDIENLYQIKRSEIQNIVIKKETDKEKFKKQVTLYRCRNCGNALRVYKNEQRTEQPKN